MFPLAKEIAVDLVWVRLVAKNPIEAIDPPVYVMEVPGGMLFRVVVPGNPVAFVPNATIADLQGS